MCWRFDANLIWLIKWICLLYIWFRHRLLLWPNFELLPSVELSGPHFPAWPCLGPDGRLRNASRLRLGAPSPWSLVCESRPARKKKIKKKWKRPRHRPLGRAPFRFHRDQWAWTERVIPYSLYREHEGPDARADPRAYWSINKMNFLTQVHIDCLLLLD